MSEESTNNNNLGFKYSQYQSNIDYMMKNMENGRYLEKSGANMDGYLANNVSKLREELNELLYAIQKNELNIQNPEKRFFKSYAERDNKVNK